MRFRAACAAIRAWARAPARVRAALRLAGTRLPGPQDTVAPAARIPLLLDIVRAGRAAGGRRAGEAPDRPPPSPALAAQLRAVAERFAPELPEHLLVTALMAWTQLFGMISFELFGQLVGTVDPGDDFFGYAVECLADQLDLPPAPDP